MQTNIIAFGIAKDIIGGQRLTFEMEDQPTVGNLKAQLCKQFPAFERLRSLAIAVNEEYQSDDFIIGERDEVVIIPPVSGG
ncbi:MAG: MoaD/ThiS family protein [Saprospiraceae bacterium]